MLGSSSSSTPVGAAIMKATNELLIGPDWGANMDICDMINSTPGGGAAAIQALRQCFRSNNPKVIQLALTVLETTVKNCRPGYHATVAERNFIKEIVAIANGSKGYEAGEAALGLIQQWGIGFERQRDRLPIFFDTYSSLKAQGKRFPPVESDAPIFTPPSNVSVGGGGASGGGGGGGGDLASQLRKLRLDVAQVTSRVERCHQLLDAGAATPGGGRPQGELGSVVGYLEACAPRLLHLVDQGISGGFGGDEEALELVLAANEEVTAALQREQTGGQRPASAAPDAAAAAAGAGGGVNQLLDGFDLLGLQPQQQQQQQQQHMALDDEEDEFAALALRGTRRPPPPVAAPSAAAAAAAPAVGLVVPPQMQYQPQQQQQQQAMAGPSTSTFSPPVPAPAPVPVAAAAAEPEFDPLGGLGGAAAAPAPAVAPAAVPQFSPPVAAPVPTPDPFSQAPAAAAPVPAAAAAAPAAAAVDDLSFLDTTDIQVNMSATDATDFLESLNAGTGGAAPTAAATAAADDDFDEFLNMRASK